MLVARMGWIDASGKVFTCIPAQETLYKRQTRRFRDRLLWWREADGLLCYGGVKRMARWRETDGEVHREDVADVARAAGGHAFRNETGD